MASHPAKLPLILKGIAALAVLAAVALAAPSIARLPPVEAPTGFDNQTNGFTTQTQFDLDRTQFEAREDLADGLGPVYNAAACAECHQSPVSGAGSQIAELRVGRFDGVAYSDPPGGSLINDRAIDAAIQEHATGADNVRTFRLSLNTLGDGYVEAIPDRAFLDLQARQPPGMKGTIIRVPVLEAPGETRVGRFGWKDQHASLLSFSADAYLNEEGITSPLVPAENTSMGLSMAAYDTVPDPEDAATPAAPYGPDVEAFARFMRATKAPARDPILAQTPEAQAGAEIFRQIGCAACHTPMLQTAPAGTALHGGRLVVSAALGDKILHPFSDFLLHDVGTGDGIVQNGGPGTRTKLRTAPLWGLRTRDRLMHDGASLTANDAILRHGQEATPVVHAFLHLSPAQKSQLMAFLASL
ncbi:MAG TPA: di-heme oxidoredictase family protein [Thermoanaerobaculia bacterium]|nr:di-heme oxidoredictase family protein [Thermoanaerobaculia bacterium]